MKKHLITAAALTLLLASQHALADDDQAKDKAEEQGQEKPIAEEEDFQTRLERMMEQQAQRAQEFSEHVQRDMEQRERVNY